MTLVFVPKIIRHLRAELIAMPFMGQTLNSFMDRVADQYCPLTFSDDRGLIDPVMMACRPEIRLFDQLPKKPILCSRKVRPKW